MQKEGEGIWNKIRMAAFNALAARLFDDDPNVAAFTTHFIMGTVKQEPVVPATSRPVAAP